MANSPKPGDARWGVVKPPNEAGPGGNRANNSFLPLVGSTGPLPPGGPGGGDRRNGSFPLGEIASPVHLPDDAVRRRDREDAAATLGDRAGQGGHPGEPVGCRGPADPSDIRSREILR